MLLSLKAAPAHAVPTARKLYDRQLTSDQYQRAKSVVNSKLKDDLSVNFEKRVKKIALAHEKDPPLDANLRAVLVEGAFEALAKLSKAPLNKAVFIQKIDHALDWAAAHGIAPSALCIQVQGRKSFGDLYTAGVNSGAEMNFYLEDGKLMMTNYSLLGIQAGVGTPFMDIEYSISFCFGSCTGGDPSGWYTGVDGDVAGGLGVGLFAEVEVNVSQLDEAFASDHEISIDDLYDATTFYIGFGFETGLGGEVALDLIHYSQIGNDIVLASPGQPIDAKVIASQASHIKPK